MDGFGNFRNDLLAAKDRDLAPLLDESAELLDLEPGKVATMEAFLDEAWFGGTYTGHIQMKGLADRQGKGPVPVDRKAIEAEMKALMEASADALDLTVPRTVAAWSYLRKAWVAGVRSSEAQIIAHFLAPRMDLAGEALKWLEEQGN